MSGTQNPDLHRNRVAPTEFGLSGVLGAVLAVAVLSRLGRAGVIGLTRWLACCSLRSSGRT